MLETALGGKQLNIGCTTKAPCINGSNQPQYLSLKGNGKPDQYLTSAEGGADTSRNVEIRATSPHCILLTKFPPQSLRVYDIPLLYSVIIYICESLTGQHEDCITCCRRFTTCFLAKRITHGVSNTLRRHLYTVGLSNNPTCKEIRH